MKFITAIFSSSSSPPAGEEAKTWTCSSKSLVFAGEGVNDPERWVPPLLRKLRAYLVSPSFRFLPLHGGRIIALILLLVLAQTETAHAGQAEVRDVALANNCTPKKIEIVQQPLGSIGDTLYQVQCNLPKTTAAADNAAKPADAILVACKMNLCDMMRPVNTDKK